MNIAQALKEKNKLVTKLSKLYSRFHQNNSVLAETKRVYEPAKLWEEILVEEAKLIDLKTSIHRASDPVRGDIFAQSELKNRIKNLRSLNTQTGKIRDHYRSETPIEMDAIFDVIWVDTTVEALEKAIENIQDKLDKFNHITQI